VYFVLVGIFEEFLLRGYALHTLSRGWGFWPAAVALSVLFGAIHVRNPGETWLGLLAVVAIGLFFCLTLYRTGSLWFAIGFHAFWDWGQTFLIQCRIAEPWSQGTCCNPHFRVRIG
jgi:membrane protease YdiL (CAAX protease family)